MQYQLIGVLDMMAYVNVKRNKDVIHIDSAGNHPMTITLEQAGKLHSELTHILEEYNLNKNPLQKSEGINPNISCT